MHDRRIWDRSLLHVGWLFLGAESACPMKRKSPVRRQEIIRFIISGGGEAAERSQGPPGKCIASPALLGFFRAEAIYFAHGSVMIRIQSLDLDLVGIILDAIHDGVSKRIVITANALIPTFIEEL